MKVNAEKLAETIAGTVHGLLKEMKEENRIMKNEIKKLSAMIHVFDEKVNQKVKYSKQKNMEIISQINQINSRIEKLEAGLSKIEAGKTE